MYATDIVEFQPHTAPTSWPTQSLLSVAFEGGDDDGADLSHTHAQKALIQALDQPALPHQGVVRLLASVAEVGLIQAQSKTHFTLRWTKHLATQSETQREEVLLDFGIFYNNV